MTTNDLKFQDLWVPLEDCPNYEVNRSGQIRYIKSGKVLKTERKSNGTVYIGLVDSSHQFVLLPVDEIVASTFLPKPDVNYNIRLQHLDGDTNNCCVDNLTWVEDDMVEKEYYSSHSVRKPREYFTFYPLSEYPDNIYEINKMGQIRNKTTHKLLKPAMREGYLFYVLRIHGKSTYHRAHILVAKQFIPNPENKPMVNHIDEDRSNSCIDNLEWVTAKENANHGTSVNKANLGRYKMINEYDIYGKYIRTWKSIKALSDFVDMIYPTCKCKYSLSVVLNYNSQNGLEKKVFANRVFTYYTDNCDDIIIAHTHAIKHKYDYHPTLDGVNVPDEYLVNDIDSSEYFLPILKNLPLTALGFTNTQREALNYAIKCVEAVEKNKM